MARGLDVITQTLEMPIEEPKKQVFSSFMSLILTASQATISETNTDTDDRVNQLIDLMISAVPNDAFRVRVRKLRDDRIEKEATILGNDNAAKGRKIKQINREIMGEVVQYMDRYAGGESINRVSFIVPIREMREIMQKYNPEHFKEHIGEVREETV